MQKVLVSLPDDLAARMRAVIPNRQRSRIIAEVLENEINRREKELYECAKGVEADDALNKEMLFSFLGLSENIRASNTF